jgi:hypothetical protein
MPELIFVAAPGFAPLTGSTPVQAPTRVQVQDHVPTVVEIVTVRPLAPAPTAYLAVPTQQWSWTELRDYVIGQIEKTIGQFPRDETKEMGIFKSFCARWGADAQPIARYAFETMGGYWKNAPVSVSRFCKGSDPYFSAPIVEHLNRHVR